MLAGVLSTVADKICVLQKPHIPDSFVTEYLTKIKLVFIGTKNLVVKKVRKSVAIHTHAQNASVRTTKHQNVKKTRTVLINNDIVSHTSSSINPFSEVHEYPSRDVIALHTNSVLDSSQQAYANRITSLTSKLMPLGENIGNMSIDYISRSDICESYL